MVFIVFIAIAAAGFYAFIGTAPNTAVQLMIFLFWMILIVGTILAEIFH